MKQTPRKSGSSSPFVCALPTTSADPGVVVFCCEPGPVLANVLDLSKRRNLLLAFLQYDMCTGTIIFRVTAIACQVVCYTSF